MKNRLAFLGSLWLALMILWGLWAFHARSTLPNIKDAGKLRDDCVLLSQQFPLGELTTNVTNLLEAKVFRARLGQEHFRDIPKENWPSSIQYLKPTRVTRDEYAVCIWIKVSRGIDRRNNWLEKGYYVHVDPSIPPRSATHGLAMYYLYETKYDNIDEFVLPMAVL